MLVRQVACGGLRKVATKCVSRCLTGWYGLPPGRGSEPACEEQIEEPDADGKRRSASQAEGQEGIRGSKGAPGRVSFTS
jgi:hypothetical protein